MAIFRKYLYCKNCERPHREWETRYYTVQTGPYTVQPRSNSFRNIHHCIGCDEILERPEPAFSQFIFLGFFLVSAFFTISSVQNGMWGNAFFSVVLGGSCIYSLVNLKNKPQYKPIYDRWVHKHGANPDNWPKSCKPD